MGLLDDAIREHLELKRRHGAAEDEVRRQEQEALGPPRRGEVPEPLAPPEPEAPYEPELEADEDLAAEPPDTEERPVAPDASRPAAVAASDILYDDDAWLDDPDDLGAPPAAVPPPEPAAEAPPQAVPAPDGEEEDVLEETPEFLQETPEHDRLWFEQKPPKDFDFDK
jgi:hypothetical protein